MPNVTTHLPPEYMMLVDIWLCLRIVKHAILTHHMEYSCKDIFHYRRWLHFVSYVFHMDCLIIMMIQLNEISKETSMFFSKKMYLKFSSALFKSLGLTKFAKVLLWTCQNSLTDWNCHHRQFFGAMLYLISLIKLQYWKPGSIPR